MYSVWDQGANDTSKCGIKRTHFWVSTRACSAWADTEHPWLFSVWRGIIARYCPRPRQKDPIQSVLQCFKRMKFTFRTDTYFYFTFQKQSLEDNLSEDQTCQNKKSLQRTLGCFLLVYRISTDRTTESNVHQQVQGAQHVTFMEELNPLRIEHPGKLIKPVY